MSENRQLLDFSLFDYVTVKTAEHTHQTARSGETIRFSDICLEFENDGQACA